MMAAAQNGHCGVVRMLLEAKADVNIKTNVSNINLLMVCVCTVYCWWTEKLAMEILIESATFDLCL